MIYVGRAFHNGDTLVAKVIPAKHIAFITWRGDQIPKEHFEILCGQNLVWQHCYDHVVPKNAILCGETSIGQSVYIGRGHYNRSLTVGKISSVHRALFIAYGGTEKRLESYEILVEQLSVKPGWALPPPPLEEDVQDIKLPLPPPLIAIDEDINVPSRATTTTSAMPTTPPNFVRAYPPEFSRPPDAPPPYAATTPTVYMPQPEVKFETKPLGFVTLPEQKFSYTHGYVPPPCEGVPLEKKFSYAETYAPPYTPPTASYTPPAASYTPAETYVPQAAPAIIPAETYTPPSMHGSSADFWVSGNESYLPPNAVIAGHEANLAPIYVCRAYHDVVNSTIPGKLVPSHRCAYITLNGMEIPKYNYEILLGDRYHWVPAVNGYVPPNAVEGGRFYGQTLYIGRAHHCGTLTPGKIVRSHCCLYIPFGGREIRINNYEVLVRSEHFY